MTLIVVDRFHPRRRENLQQALDANRLRICDELELLTPEAIQPLARLGIYMLMGGSLFFIVLNCASYFWHEHALNPSLSLPDVLFWVLNSPRTALSMVLLWLAINVAGYLIILPIHELIHGLMFLFWGGKPFFGAKLPFALYCGARQQLFMRNHYLTIGLAPLIILTVIFFIFTLFSPVAASYTLLANVGNFSGAVGDVWVALRVSRQPSTVLVEDTDLGYRARELAPS